MGSVIGNGEYPPGVFFKRYQFFFDQKKVSIFFDETIKRSQIFREFLVSIYF